jgi:hypothetical protein
LCRWFNSALGHQFPQRLSAELVCLQIGLGWPTDRLAPFPVGAYRHQSSPSLRFGPRKPCSRSSCGALSTELLGARYRGLYFQQDEYRSGGSPQFATNASLIDAKALDFDLPRGNSSVIQKGGWGKTRSFGNQTNRVSDGAGRFANKGGVRSQRAFSVLDAKLSK